MDIFNGQGNKIFKKQKLSPGTHFTFISSEVKYNHILHCIVIIYRFMKLCHKINFRKTAKLKTEKLFFPVIWGNSFLSENAI